MREIGLDWELGGQFALAAPFAQYKANGFAPAVIGDFKKEAYAINGASKSFGDIFINSGGSLVSDGWSMDSTGGDTLKIPAATITAALGGAMPPAISIAIKCKATFSDNDTTAEIRLTSWQVDSSNYVEQRIRTDGAKTGGLYMLQNESGNLRTVFGLDTAYSPGTDVPMSVASSHSAGRTNAAADGVALSETLWTPPPNLADLMSEDFKICVKGVMKIERLLIWADDIGDQGLTETTS